MENAVDRFLNQIKLNWKFKIAIVATCLIELMIIGSSNVEKFGPILAYCYGSIPFGFIITKFWTGKDLSAEGSTNVGMANSYNVGGMVPAIITVTGEISKALVPLAVSYLFFDFSLTISCALLVGSYLGTNFSIFLNGKGGMGTTMMLWSLIFLSPFSAMVLIIFMAITMKLMKDSYHTALLNYMVGPLLVAIIDQRLVLIAFVTFAAIIYLIKLKRDMDDFGVRKRMMDGRSKPS